MTLASIRYLVPIIEMALLSKCFGKDDCISLVYLIKMYVLICSVYWHHQSNELFTLLWSLNLNLIQNVILIASDVSLRNRALSKTS